MGLDVGAIKVLIHEAKRIPFTGRVLTLGRQDLLVSYKRLSKIATDANFELKNKSNDSFTDKELFNCLGFSESKALDFSDYEGVDYIFDLNSNKKLPFAVESFDVIIDSGTLEHIFHIPNALKNLFRMLKKDGRIIHISPSSNYLDHGFFMISPTFYWDYYEVNNFEINTIQVIKHAPKLHSKWKMHDYYPGCLNRISFGRLDSSMYATLSIVTKTKNSTCDLIPQQGFYQKKMWVEKPRALKGFERLKDKIKKNKILFFFYSSLQKRIISRSLRLKVKNKY